jgi:hypothetical protein
VLWSLIRLGKPVAHAQMSLTSCNEVEKVSAGPIGNRIMFTSLMVHVLVLLECVVCGELVGHSQLFTCK